MKIYRVGGSVRDELLGLPVADRDYVVVGATPQAMRAGGFRPVGRDFPVFLHPRTHEEYALARTERKTSRGHRGFSFHAAPEVTLEEDLARRDLTINAMARADDGTLIDPFGGERDLREGVLRHVGPAFTEDPLRVLRVARFAARFGFSVAPETAALMRAIAAGGELETLSAERVWQELAKALMEAKPSRFFVILRRCGALGQLLPELEALFAASARRSGGSASLRAVDAAAVAGEALAVRYAVLAGNLGGAARTRERLAASFSRRVNAPTECRELAGLGARLRDRIDRATALAPAALLDLLLAMDALRRPERLAGLLRVCGLWRRTARVSRAASDTPAARLTEALRVIRGVKAEPLAAGGRDIARRIRAARLRALREWLKAQKR
ncbi:MAG TPA: multifunctional CCA tRNA nucleotidyl transferase/2'3'-cyclic phosphodiesterase/2'nucleotidase/phosphatase [Casimicrobiaceae bacterium]|nr:multifunctional CCA tRNA nucleotidyl transferase/2'3'-cyclic phosphodiesterase/2'nucleotidase/phosphatase [Casimicrobiaceae bacterium]